MRKNAARRSCRSGSGSVHLFPAHAGSRFKRPDLVVGRRAGRRLKGKPTLDQRLAPEKPAIGAVGSWAGRERMPPTRDNFSLRQDDAYDRRYCS